MTPELGCGQFFQIPEFENHSIVLDDVMVAVRTADAPSPRPTAPMSIELAGKKLASRVFSSDFGDVAVSFSEAHLAEFPLEKFADLRRELLGVALEKRLDDSGRRRVGHRQR